MIRFLRQRQMLFPLVLALLAAAVLFVGALEQRRAEAEPDRPPADPLPVETPRPVARADLDKTPLTYFSDYWGQLAERAGPRLTSVGSNRTPGLVVGPRLVLTTLAPAHELLAEQGRPVLAVDDDDAAGEAVAEPSESGGASAPGMVGYRLLGWDDDLGLALFEASGDERVPFTLTDPRAMPSGSYVGAVTLTAAGEPAVTPGYLVTTTPANDDAPTGDLVVSMDLAETLSIAAVVNLDGALIGVAYSAPTGRRVISSTTMLDLIESIQTEKVCRSVEVTDLQPRVKEIMVLESGVLVAYVHEEAFDPEPSLRAGDVLLEWAGTRIESAAHFHELYDADAPGALVRYRILRNRRRISGGTVIPGRDCEPVGPPPLLFPSIGMAVEWRSTAAAADAAWTVVAVAPNGPAARVGVTEQDRLVAIDGIGVSDRDDGEMISRRVDRGEPLLLSLAHGDRMKLVSVEPAAETSGAAEVSDSADQPVPLAR